MSIRRTPVQPKEVVPVGISFDSATGLLMTAASDILDFPKPSSVISTCEPTSNLNNNNSSAGKRGSRSKKILSNRDVREKMMLSALDGTYSSNINYESVDKNVRPKRAAKKLQAKNDKSDDSCEKFCQCTVPLIK